MEEIWKPIPGFQGRYEASSLGRLRSVPGRKSGSILSQSSDGHGYLKVTVYERIGCRKSVYVHRLIALAFLPNPQCLPCVNHKDEDKMNNCVSNLEWCTQEYNINYGNRTQKVQEKTWKPVGKYDKEGNLLATYPSVYAAAEANGVYWRFLKKVAQGQPHHLTAKGYVYRYL